jgi:hypothetical protein
MNTIYNHDITLYTHDLSINNHLYASRALALTVPGDKIQLPRQLATDWEAIAAHYQNVGINHTDDVVWDVAIEETARHPDYNVSVYFFGDVVNDHDRYRQIFRQWSEQRCQVIEFVNSKNNFIQLAEELGIPVPETLRFEHLAAAKACSSVPFPCYVKPAVSDHGAGIVRCENAAELDQAFAQLPNDVPLQIQAEVKASAFLNLQYQVTATGVEPLLASEQILDGCVHGGNRYPTGHEPWDHIAPFAQWVGDRGMQDIFAVDVAVVPDGDSIRYVAIECNPRFNGSSYPTIIAKRLGIPAWSSATYKCSVRSLNDLDLTDVEFDPETGAGVILTNWGTIKGGKISVLLAGNETEQTDLATEFQARLRQP